MMIRMTTLTIQTRMEILVAQVLVAPAAALGVAVEEMAATAGIMEEMIKYFLALPVAGLWR